MFYICYWLLFILLSVFNLESVAPNHKDLILDTMTVCSPISLLLNKSAIWTSIQPWNTGWDCIAMYNSHFKCPCALLKCNRLRPKHRDCVLAHFNAVRRMEWTSIQSQCTWLWYIVKYNSKFSYKLVLTAFTYFMKKVLSVNSSMLDIQFGFYSWEHFRWFYPENGFILRTVTGFMHAFCNDLYFKNECTESDMT